MEKEHLDLSVAVFKPMQNKLKHLYDHVSTFEEAHLLAIDAMNKKNERELIVILPGWNIKMNEDDTEKILELLERYGEDKFLYGNR